MKIIKPKSWSEFLETLEEIKTTYGKNCRTLPYGEVFEDEISIIYRGQADKEWKLSTTLERKTSNEYDVLGYIHTASINAEEVESMTDVTWNVPKYPELEERILQIQDTFRVPLPCYDYLVYLRHHGYPSPLLDWTKSPYIAAFFAFLDATKTDPAIFCFIERGVSAKFNIGRQPKITVQGPYVKTHKRHYAQKALYTIATKWDYTNKKHIFVPHESVFNLGHDDQDIVIKIELPNSIRKEALNHLNDYNINPYALYQSEDSLVKYMELRNFDL